MKKTQGQRRQKWVRVVVLAAFLITSAIGIFGYQKLMGSAYAWVDNHGEVQATIIDLKVEEEEYRNRKGRKRTRTNYFARYQFDSNGEKITGSFKTSSGRYEQLGIGDGISVWYDVDDPYTSAPREKVENGKASSPVAALISVLPFTLGFAWFLNAFLGFLFIRESNSKLNEGFYTDSSWLDIEDNKLVLLDATSVSVSTLKDKQIKKITAAYQNNSSHKELSAMLNSDQQESVEIANITGVISRHDEDKIHVLTEEDSISLDFLNNGTKAHAFERLQKVLPENLQSTVERRTRLRSAAPRLVFLGILFGAGFLINDGLIWFMAVAVALLFIVPKTIRRLIDPTVVTEYKKSDEIVKTEVCEKPELKKAA